MRQALLLIQTKGKPDERVTGDWESVKAKFKALSVPDTHATLYELRRDKTKHVPAAAKPAKTQTETKKSKG